MSTTQSHIDSYAKPAGIKFCRGAQSVISFIRESCFDLATMRPRHLFATCLIALTMILPASGYVLSKLLEQIGDNLSRARTISVFIENQPDIKLGQLTNTLTRYEQIELAEPVTVPIDPTLAGTNTSQMVEVIPSAGLPADHFAALIDQLRSLPGVEMVSWNNETLARNLQASAFAELFASVSLILAAALLTLTTWWLIRKNIQSSKEIVDIKHHLGATPMQICRPMLLKGILLGIVAGIIGYALSAAGSAMLGNLVDIPIFNIDVRPGLLQILLGLIAVIIISYVITRMAFRRIFFYIYQ